MTTFCLPLRPLFGALLVLLLAIPVHAQTPLPSPTPLHFNLDSALEEGIIHSPDLAQYRSKVAQSSFQKEEALSAFRAQFGFSAALIQIQPSEALDFLGTTIQIIAEQNYSVGVTLSQAILTFGRLHWRKEAAGLAIKAAEQDYRRQAEGLLDQITTSYAQVLLAQDAVVIAQSRVNDAQAHLKDAQSLYHAGASARYDVIRTQADLSDAQQVLLAANNDKSRAAATLLSQIGESPTLDLVLDPLPPPQPPPTDQTAALAQAYARRPELVSLRFGIREAEALVYWNQSNRNPMLNFTSGLVTQNPVGFTEPNTWTTQLQLKYSVLDGGLTQSQIGEARETLEQLKQQHESVRRTVELEVESTWLDLQSDWARMQVTRVQIEEAAEALRVAEVRYRNGVGTNVERLDAANALTVAQVADTRANYAYIQAQSHWRRVTSVPYPVAVAGLNPLGRVLKTLENFQSTHVLQNLPPLPVERAVDENESGQPRGSGASTPSGSKQTP